jgi:nicotinamidase-related amidase
VGSQQIVYARAVILMRMTPEPIHEVKLHSWYIDPKEYARHEKRRGKRHAYQSIQVARTALIVIDMIPFYVNENPYCRGIVPNILRLATLLRTVGGVVVWVVPAVETSVSDVRREFYGDAVSELYNKASGSGSPRERIWDEFDILPGDLFIEKSASSAFFPGYSPLHTMLQERNIQTVLITGTVTNVCCESSARDASTLGYRVIMIADANAGVSDQSHNASLTTIYRLFGDVRPTQEVMDLIRIDQRSPRIS